MRVQTQSWKTCQKLCNPQGSRGLNRRMFEFEPDRVHPEIVARSKEMLLDIDIAKVQAVGPAAITFYVWVRTAVLIFHTGVLVTDRVVFGKVVRSVVSVCFLLYLLNQLLWP